jgi:HEAT repeat protein
MKMSMFRVALFVTILLFSMIAIAADTAVYNGKPLAHWMKLARSQNVEDRLAAMRAYEHFASNGVANEPMMRQVVGALSDTDRETRLLATQVLPKVVSSSTAFVRDVAIDALAKRLDDEEKAIRQTAIHSMVALARIDRVTVCKRLMPAVTTGTSRLQAAALLTIAEVGSAEPYERPLRNAIRQALAADDITVRSAAIRAYGALPPTKENLVQLTSYLLSPETPIREAANRTLAGLALRHGEYVETFLIERLGGEEQTKVAILGVLASMGPAVHTSVIQSVLPLAADRQASVRLAVVRTAGSIGTAAPDPIVALLARRLTVEPIESIRVEIVQSLGRIGAEQPGLCIRPLVRSARDPSIPLRVAVADSLATIAAEQSNLASPRPEVLEASEQLAQLLRDENATVRHSAASGLGRLSETRPHIIEAISRATGDTNPNVRSAAAAAMERLQAKRRSAPSGDSVD